MPANLSMPRPSAGQIHSPVLADAPSGVAYFVS